MAKRGEGGEVVHSRKVPSGTKTELHKGTPDLPPAPKPKVESRLSRKPDGDKTVLVRGTYDEIVQTQGSTDIDPVVGWLVVKSGPLLGKSFDVTYGNNTVGRSPASAISLGEHDKAVSRDKHCILTYDPKGRKFYLGSGESRNLTYLNDEPVLNVQNIQSRAKITLGNTELLFVALCGPDFDWQDADA